MGYSYEEELGMYMDDDGHMLTEDMLPEDMQERLRMQRIDDTLYASRNNRTGIIDTISHRITGTYFNRNLILIHQFHKLHTERHYITVYICSCDIFKMTSYTDALLKAIPNH